MNTDGIRLAGAPIGTADFCQKYVAAKMDETIRTLDTLKGFDPQAGLAMVRSTMIPELAYLAQVTPPEYMVPELERFDAHVMQTIMGLLTPVDGPAPPPCVRSRVERAEQKLTAPMRDGGAGLTKTAFTAPIAYFSSVVSSQQSDKDLAKHAGGLARFTEEAHKMIVSRVGNQPIQVQPPREPGEEKSAPPVTIFTQDTKDLLQKERFYDQAFSKLPELKLQKELSKAMHDATKGERLLQLQEMKDGLEESDVVAEMAQLGMGEWRKIFTLGLTKRHSAMSPTDFICFMRFCPRF